jgi:hypothetical protein
MIRHIVFWKIHKDGSPEQRRLTCDQFSEKTAYLKKIIPQIIEARVGYNQAATAAEDQFHICIESLFRSWEDLDIYINHPEHLKVREFLNTVQYEKTVFDYEY